MPAYHHRLEETGRFRHLPFQFFYRTVVDIDDDVSVPFDAGDMMHFYVH